MQKGKNRIKTQYQQFINPINGIQFISPSSVTMSPHCRQVRQIMGGGGLWYRLGYRSSLELGHHLCMNERRLWVTGPNTYCQPVSCQKIYSSLLPGCWMGGAYRPLGCRLLSGLQVRVKETGWKDMGHLVKLHCNTIDIMFFKWQMSQR